MIYTLTQLVEQSSLNFPDKVAFQCLDYSISYKDLDYKSNQIALYLIQMGVKKGDRVGIYMNRCLDAPIAVFGVLKAGAAYVPIDTFAPISRSLYVLEDCGIEYVLTTPSQQKKINSITKEALHLKSVIGVLDSYAEKTVEWNDVFSISTVAYRPQRILEQDLAFILYTSGSTGNPKAIMHTHNSALSLVKIVSDLFKFTADDRVGIFPPLHFDMCLFGYFGSPLVGATAIIVPDAYLALPASLSSLVAKEEISIWYSVPYILTQVLLRGEMEKYDFSSLRWVLFAGEVFISKHLRALMLQWPHAKFANIYGPVETIVCAYHVLADPPQIDEPIPIGTVWGNTEYKILDSDNNELKKGSTGELVVRSVSMMQGYWNNPELTEKAFYKVKIAPGYDHVYYRTGDLMRENAKGELMFIGRNDRQLKIRGFRVELDGIERMLLQNKNVEESAVITIEADKDNIELVAIVRPVTGATLDPKDLLKFCKSVMPSYAVPQKILIRKNFPRTSTGKINRKEILKEISS